MSSLSHHLNSRRLSGDTIGKRWSILNENIIPNITVRNLDLFCKLINLNPGKINIIKNTGNVLYKTTRQSTAIFFSLR